MPLRKIDSITIWKKNGKDAYAKSTFDAPAGILGRWDQRTQRMDDSEGLEFVSKGLIYTDVEGEIEVGDRVLLREYLIGDAPEHGFEDSYIVKSTSVDRNGTGTKRLDTAFLARPK